MTAVRELVAWVSGTLFIAKRELLALFVTPLHRDELPVITIIQQVLAIEHVIPHFVLGVHRGGIKRVEKIHGLIDQTITPADRLATKSHDGFVTGVIHMQAIQSLHNHLGIVINDLVAQVPPAPVIIWHGWG